MRFLIAICLCSVLVFCSTARAADPTTKPTEISPASIYSTSRQAGLRQTQDWPLFQQPDHSPAICGIAWADSFADLASATLVTVSDDKPARSLERPAAPDTTLWAIVYLGSTGSTPPQFLLDSVVVQKDGTFEVTYHTAAPGPVTMDMFPYVLWIPLGKLAAGDYSIRLIEKIDKQPDKTMASGKWSITDRH